MLLIITNDADQGWFCCPFHCSPEAILAGFLVGGISGSVRCGSFSSEQEMLLYCVDIVTSATAIVRPA